VSNLCVAKGHTRYCGLVFGPRVEKISVPKCVYYCETFIVGTQFTYVAMGCKLETCGLKVKEVKCIMLGFEQMSCSVERNVFKIQTFY
jgi:hypothetical protein